MKIRTAYGSVISQARYARGLSLRETAELAQISYNYLHEIEKGKKEASSEFLGYILTALHMPPVEFFTRVANEYQRLADQYHASVAK